jgi:hypothetical protein
VGRSATWKSKVTLALLLKRLITKNDLKNGATTKGNKMGTKSHIALLNEGTKGIISIELHSTPKICVHNWQRRRDGRSCLLCGVIEFGVDIPRDDKITLTSPIKEELG